MNENFRTKPDRCVGFAIIGAGGISQCHAAAILQTPGAELVGVYDTIQAAAHRLAERFGCRMYATLEELLADASVEAVTVATPSGTHCELAMAAAQAGKHVLCEKPLDVTLDRIDRMIRVCKENHVLLSSVFQMRYAPDIQRVKSAVIAGRFGKMVLASTQMRWFRDAEYYHGNAWRGRKSLDGGGALMNQAIHMVDLLLYLNGPAEEVYSVAGALTHDIEVEDTLCAVIRYCNGSFGTIEASTSCAPDSQPRRLELSGDGGSVAVAEDRLTHWEFSRPLPGDAELQSEIQRRPLPKPATAVPDSVGHARQVANFVEAIRSGIPLEIDGTEARRAVALICAIYESAKSGRPVRLSNP